MFKRIHFPQPKTKKNGKESNFERELEFRLTAKNVRYHIFKLEAGWVIYGYSNNFGRQQQGKLRSRDEIRNKKDQHSSPE